MPATFRGRLTLTLSALSIGVLALVGVLIYAGIRWALVRNLDEALLALAGTEMASAFDEPGGQVHVHDEAPAAIDLGDQTALEKVSMIIDAAGEVVARTSNLAGGPPLDVDPSLVAQARAGDPVFADTLRGTVPYRTLHHPLDDADGNRLVIVVALSRHPLELTLQAIAGVLFLALAGGGVLAGVAAAGLSRRLTRPLERIAAAAREVGETNLAARIPETSSDRELRAMVRRLNDMLARIETAFAAQRRFIADASHELRSPLANVRGTIEVALRHPRSAEDYRGTLRVALAEIDRLGRLVRGLLTLSRADAGRLALGHVPTDLVQLAARAIEVHAARAASRDVRLELDAAAPALVEGDPDRLREIVDNLLDNALRVSPPGSAVSIRVQGAHGHVALDVEDEGPGLTEDEQTRVFERFARGAASGGDGAGLGLAIAKAIAEAHGGVLGVGSTVGKGAVFRLELPALARAAGDGDGAAAPGAASAFPPRRRAG